MKPLVFAAYALIAAAPAIAAGGEFSAAPTTAAPGKFSAADEAAIFKAAGFKKKGGKQIRCEDDGSTSFTPGTIEPADLNGDGTNEAFVREISTNCYGNTAEAFVIVAKDANGRWTAILDQVGISVVLETKSKDGWKDIEVGLPGMGPFPKFRHNGMKYVAKK